jgi:RimJ/RimL family protein N-acetyltransferase
VTRSGSEILRFSPLESARFGLRVFRASVDAIDADRIADEIERERIDVAILRLPATAMAGAEALRRYGFDPIAADTQVVYGIELDAYARAWSASSTPPPLPRREDTAVLDRMARAIFADYESHYTANPLFAREKIVDGYAEWAARHVVSDDGSAAWLVEKAGVLAGFSCYRIDSASGTAVGVLNGVLPAARGRGVYGGMLHRMLDYFAGIGLRRFEIATQTHNTIVQRVWAEHGLSLRATHKTLHVNALHGNAAGSFQARRH